MVSVIGSWLETVGLLCMYNDTGLPQLAEQIKYPVCHTFMLKKHFWCTSVIIFWSLWLMVLILRRFNGYRWFLAFPEWVFSIISAKSVTIYRSVWNIQLIEKFKDKYALSAILCYSGEFQIGSIKNFFRWDLIVLLQHVIAFCRVKY